MKILIFVFLAVAVSISGLANNSVVIGSKKFTESVTLAEIAKAALEQKGIKATHKAELGGTRILWNALLTGDIDIYPEYSGTIEEEILKEKINNFEQLKIKLAQKGIGVSTPLGFNNTYALGMKKSKAEELNITDISDLAKHSDLKMGLSEEFKQRKDGWPGLKLKYNLPQRFVRGLDHDIAYRALESGNIDVTDFYSTDAEIKYYNLQTLNDDQNYFPHYNALYLYKLNTAQKFPQLTDTLNSLGSKINNQKMIELNNLVKIKHQTSTQVAADFLSQLFNLKIANQQDTRGERLLLRTKEHIKLVSVSLLFAILFALPLGIIAAKKSAVGKLILWIVSGIQTIPALALLVILIKPLNMVGLQGIGDTPAFIALFLYSLLPIVRATHSGFMQIQQSLKDVANVLNFSFKTKLLKIELPLALPSILSGIKTSAVMNVGFATLGALVGAGGYGQPILTGIRLDDYGLILEGAIPAVILTLLAQLFFDLLERFITSPGLRK